MILMNEVGDFLRKIRIQKKLTLKQVQKDTNITDSRLSKLERGRITDISAETLLILARYYNINIIQLYLMVGYLNEEDIPKNNILRNVERLTSEEDEHIQNQIDFLLTHKRGEENEF